ncbi:MAG: UDP-N-acetylmuramate dehydrogenase [Candidatus Binatia bacterium]
MRSMRKDGDETFLLQELKHIPGMKMKVGESLARHTSMKIGGPAEYFFEVENNSALAALLSLVRQHDLPFCLLGNGSNVLISDLGIRGAVIHLAGDFKRVEWSEGRATASANVGAAYPVARLVREAARRGCAGLEFAEGIPGSMGGALVMNAGAYGSEFEKVVDRVDGVTQEGKPIRFSREEMTFSYRDSGLPAGIVVTRIGLRLRKEDVAQVSSKLRELVTKRKSSQPSGLPNSGSMFRNPPGDFAGRLIEAAGLKGRRIGQAQISERHANFIVNRGGAKADEVRRLMELAGAEVLRQFRVKLEPEVRFLGEWEDAAASEG